jgi:hypothetical protein
MHFRFICRITQGKYLIRGHQRSITRLGPRSLDQKHYIGGCLSWVYEETKQVKKKVRRERTKLGAFFAGLFHHFPLFTLLFLDDFL